jgi:hypothetical protein
MKGLFPASVWQRERDSSIAPAVLELAETRAIARSLRFAGYGVEYCSAEEVSHLQLNGGNNPPPDEKPQTKPPQEGPKGGDSDKPGGGGNGGDKGGGNGGNGDARISNKQLNYHHPWKGAQTELEDLDQESVKTYGEDGFPDHETGKRLIDTWKERFARPTNHKPLTEEREFVPALPFAFQKGENHGSRICQTLRGEEMETHLHFSFSSSTPTLCCPMKFAHTYVGEPHLNQTYRTSIREGNPQRRRSLLPVSHGDREIIPVDQIIETFKAVDRRPRIPTWSSP